MRIYLLALLLSGCGSALPVAAIDAGAPCDGGECDLAPSVLCALALGAYLQACECGVATSEKPCMTGWFATQGEPNATCEQVTEIADRARFVACIRVLGGETCSTEIPNECSSQLVF